MSHAGMGGRVCEVQGTAGACLVCWKHGTLNVEETPSPTPAAQQYVVVLSGKTFPFPQPLFLQLQEGVGAVPAVWVQKDLRLSAQRHRC